MHNINSGYGLLSAIALSNGIATFGKFFVVMPSTDPNYQKWSQMAKVDADGEVRLFTSLDDAYDACVTQRNDVIFLSAYAAHSLDAGIAWSKSRIHVVGMDGGDRLQAQGAKVQLATAATTAYVIRNTGTRNSFRNIKFIQAATANTGIHVVEEGGEGTLYKNCSFTFGVVDNLDLTTAVEFTCGSDTGTYLNCTFGAATLTTTASGGRKVLIYDAVTGGATTPRDNIFKDCIFTIESADAGSLFVAMAASGDAKGINVFDSCTFVASLVNGGGIALTKAVSTANGLTDGIFCYGYPRAYNVANFGTNGTNNDNLYVMSPAMSNVDAFAFQPIAT